MFLAFNEIKHAKLRYGLIFGLLTLIAYLLFFLTALAYGLMQENRSAVDKWQADNIILSRDAEANLTLSNFSLAKEEEVRADQVAPLAQLSIVAWSVKSPSDADKEKVSLLGIQPSSFLMPDIVEGRAIKSDKEIVIDKSLAEKAAFKLGGDFYLSGSDVTFKIVGYTQNASLSVTPVAYVSLEAINTLKYGSDAVSDDKIMVNALVIKGQVQSYPDEDLKAIKIKTFISKLPGFAAQNMTFAFMIGFLVVIAAIIIGIFMYILTIQKTQIFGIMKAQGISNLTISKAVLWQSFLLSFLASAVGLLLCWLTSLFLPTAVPFQINGFFYTGIYSAICLFALLGSLFSVLAVVQIDPLKAIG